MSGLILLVFLAVIVAFGFTRLRGRMKLGVTSKHWTTSSSSWCWSPTPRTAATETPAAG
jgi:hypothetical protein